MSPSVLQESAEERRAGRIRGRRFPRPSTDDDDLQTPRCTPTPSPHTTPEPPSQGEGSATELQQGEGGGEGRPCTATTNAANGWLLPFATRAARRAPTPPPTRRGARSDRGRPQGRRQGAAAGRGLGGARGEFSLIEHYPPRERLTLSGSDSGGSGSTPPPTAPRGLLRGRDRAGRGEGAGAAHPPRLPSGGQRRRPSPPHHHGPRPAHRVQPLQAGLGQPGGAKAGRHHALTYNPGGPHPPCFCSELEKSNLVEAY
nr:uncharacterized protein LOC113818875 [Penaeus vannamei]